MGLTPRKEAGHLERLVDGVVCQKRLMTFLRGVGRASEINSSWDVVDGDARPAEIFPNRDRHRGRVVCCEQGGEDIREEVGGGGEIVRRSVWAPCEHQVVLRSPPRSGDGSLVGGGTECGI
jgi:hypothetical protein